jgi:hypothetical protein
VVTLPTMQLVDGALKGQQCRDRLKAAGYDFKLDDYLTREEMQERMRMRPVQRRLQQAGHRRDVPWRAAVAADGTGGGCPWCQQGMGEGGRGAHRLGHGPLMPCTWV